MSPTANQTVAAIYNFLIAPRLAMAFYKDFIRMRSETEEAVRTYINVCGAGPTPPGVSAHTTHKHHIFYCSNVTVGGDLLSHTLPGAVPSAQAGLASGFGKGPGVSLPL